MCGIFGEMGENAATSEVITALMNVLKDEGLDVREMACEAIVNMNEKKRRPK